MKNESHRLWDLISGTQFADFEIVDYDHLFFNDYNKLIKKFESYKNSKVNLIIDKSCEHLHDDNPNNIETLNYFLENYNCKSNSIVFDNTFDNFYYTKYDIKQIQAPFYIYHYLAKLNLKVPIWNSKVNYTFVCLNNTHKPHRQKFIENLHHNNFLTKTKWSYRQPANSVIVTTPKYLDQDNESFDQNSNLKSLYSDALISLTTETDFHSKNITHVTEKSLWSIFYGAINVVIGVPGAIELMRSWGLDTYDDIIDHNYDSILDNNKRLDYIIKECERWYHERFTDKIRNLIAVRVLRNQLLLSNKEYWQNQIKRILWDYKY